MSVSEEHTHTHTHTLSSGRVVYSYRLSICLHYSVHVTLCNILSNYFLPVIDDVSLADTVYCCFISQASDSQLQINIWSEVEYHSLLLKTWWSNVSSLNVNIFCFGSSLTINWRSLWTNQTSEDAALGFWNSTELIVVENRCDDAVSSCSCRRPAPTAFAVSRPINTFLLCVFLWNAP